IRMSLQPVVENAVRHGLLPKKGDGTVSIEARRKDSILEVTVMDDGVGMTEETLADLNAGPDQDGTDVQTGDKGLDTGIRNVHDRIRRTFGPGYGLKIMSNEGKGTVVVFCLPFIPDKAEPEEEGNAQQGSDGTSSDRICE
ncbi:sensor histidine kinase, partial [Enterocloster hominis (ex Hitch et al. 2024)]